MTLYKKGDIILSRYHFSDGRGSKIRPLLILSQDREDFLVAMISTQVDQGSNYDILIDPDTENGLRRSSLIRLSKISTYSGETFMKKLGTIDLLTRQKIKNNMLRFIDSR